MASWVANTSGELANRMERRDDIATANGLYSPTTAQPPSVGSGKITPLTNMPNDRMGPDTLCTSGDATPSIAKNNPEQRKNIVAKKNTGIAPQALNENHSRVKTTNDISNATLTRLSNASLPNDATTDTESGTDVFIDS